MDIIALVRPPTWVRLPPNQTMETLLEWLLVMRADSHPAIKKINGMIKGFEINLARILNYL